MRSLSSEEQLQIGCPLKSLYKLGDVLLARTMPGSIRLHLELSPEDADRIYAATQNGQLAAFGISEVRLYPAIVVPPEGEERSQLLILLDRVKPVSMDDLDSGNRSVSDYSCAEGPGAVQGADRQVRVEMAYYLS
jgi:hypothetical protein